MSDCQNVTMREALPELLHGLLQDGERRVVEAHVALCVDCTEELAILEAVFASASAPAIDVARIVAVIPPYAPAAPARVAETVHLAASAGVIPLRPRSTSRSTWSSRAARLQLAAAFVLAAVGISTVAVVAHDRQQRGATPAAVATHAARSDTGVSLVATADLSDAELATLIKDMDSMQALPPAEPEPIAPAMDGGV